MQRVFSVTVCVLIARAAHLVFFLVLGNLYGADATTDTVFFLYTPLSVIMSVAAGVADVVVMPALYKAKQIDGGSELQRVFFRYSLTVTPVITGAALLGAWLLVPHVSASLLLLLFLIPLFAALTAVLTGVLNARGHFHRAVLPPMYGAVIAAPLAYLAPRSEHSLVVALLAFEVARFAGMLLSGPAYPRRLAEFGSDGRVIVRWVVNNARWQILGQMLIALNPLVNILYARLLGDGAVTSVEYAGRLWNVVPLLFAGYLTIQYAGMSRDAALGSLKVQRVDALAVRLGVAAFALSLVAIAVSTPAIELLYGLGAMKPETRTDLAALLSCLLIGSGPYMASMAYVRALSAQGRTIVLARIAVVTVLINVACNALLVNAIGLAGIGLANSLSFTATLCLHAYSFRSGK